MQMLKRSEDNQLSGFLRCDFCRVGPGKAKEIAEKAGMTGRTWLTKIGHDEAESLYQAIQDVRITAPPH